MGCFSLANAIAQGVSMLSMQPTYLAPQALFARNLCCFLPQSGGGAQSKRNWGLSRSLTTMLSAESVSSSAELVAADELGWLTSGTLARRDEQVKSSLGRASRSRHLYFRPNADFDRLISVCTDHILANAGNAASVRARMIRASALLKKGVPYCCLRGRL